MGHSMCSRKYLQKSEIYSSKICFRIYKYHFAAATFGSQEGPILQRCPPLAYGDRDVTCLPEVGPLNIPLNVGFGSVVKCTPGDLMIGLIV